MGGGKEESDVRVVPRYEHGMHTGTCSLDGEGNPRSTSVGVSTVDSKEREISQSVGIHRNFFLLPHDASSQHQGSRAEAA